MKKPAKSTYSIIGFDIQAGRNRTFILLQNTLRIQIGVVLEELT